MSEDRHINFKLMRQYILDHQDGSAPPPAAGGLYSIQPRATGVEKSKKYWRSLDELAETPEFRELVAREFPHAAEEWNDPFERRTFLKLMGASLALAGFSGCAFQPPEKIVPYVNQPEEEVPGKALFFATASSLGGIATPLLIRTVATATRRIAVQARPTFLRRLLFLVFMIPIARRRRFTATKRAPGPPLSARFAPRSTNNGPSKAPA